jgi:hypothetical protein
VFGQRYANTGLPLGGEFQVNTTTTSYQGSQAVASDGSGNFVVVWVSSDQDGNGIFGQRYSSAGSPVGPEFRVNTYTTGQQRVPDIAADASGNFVVVWQSADQDASSYGVFGQRYANTGNALGPEFRVNTHTTSSQEAPAVDSDPGGNFVVVWESQYQDGSSLGIFGQRYSNTGAALGPEFPVNTYTASPQRDPAVTVDAFGNFVVVWASFMQDGDSYGVFGQRYASSGVPVGPEFRVNTFVTASQLNPTVGSDPSGNFVVVWASSNQDGSNFGVFGQRYNQIVPVELMQFRVE